MTLPRRIVLKDRTTALVRAWADAFRDVETVSATQGDFLNEPADAAVSPANSFGFMDGGLDLVLARALPGIQDVVQTRIRDHHHGELPVGVAEVVATGHASWPLLVCAPTMRVPEDISRTIHSYLAFRAALLAVVAWNEGDPAHRIDTLLVPGLGTGVGRVAPDRCAQQMRVAFDAVVQPAGIASFSARQSEHIRLMAD